MESNQTYPDGQLGLSTEDSRALYSTAWHRNHPEDNHSIKR